MQRTFDLIANVVDIPGRQILPRRVRVERGQIIALDSISQSPETFLIPGFIDAHVHVESSMLVPSEFAAAAVRHGTVATVSDPHEIGNVLGMDGVEFMLQNAASVPFKFCFGAPACVPATQFETAGAKIDVHDVQRLMQDPRIGYLSEVMDFPAVLRRDPEIMQKIAAAQDAGKVVDGHAPGLRGADARRYVSAGISTDHECFTLEEALDKIAAGCHIAIREGSAARNFEALHSLLGTHPERVMLCSDDKHPDELLQGHIDQLAARAIALGFEVFDVLQAACLNPVNHYSLPVGQLRVGDPADFVEVNDLTHFQVQRTWIDGQLVAEKGRSLIATQPVVPQNRFLATTKTPADFAVPAKGDTLWAIEALHGQLITNRISATTAIQYGQAVAAPAEDLLKLTVVNRYMDAPPAVAFVKGFGLREGALASSVAHDSHNVIAVGADDECLCQAVNLVVECQGALAVATATRQETLPLPVAGLMSTLSVEEVAQDYQRLDQLAKQLGAVLPAPFMTLSFLALLVIPELKLSDRGLFDGKSFEFTELFG